MQTYKMPKIRFLSNHIRLVRVSTRHFLVTRSDLLGCHGAVATLLRARGNVVMGPWQRYHAGVATGEVPCKIGNTREIIGRKRLANEEFMIK